MKLNAPRISNTGEIEKERLIFKAKSDGDAGTFAIFACVREGENTVSDGDIPHTFWLPDKPFLAGDLLVLYTKIGDTGEKENNSGGKSHFFYWGKDMPMWDEKLRPVMVDVSSWQFSEE